MADGGERGLMRNEYSGENIDFAEVVLAPY